MLCVSYPRSNGGALTGNRKFRITNLWKPNQAQAQHAGSTPVITMGTLILDNGAGHIKAALIPQDSGNEERSVKDDVCELSILNALVRPGKTALAYPVSKIGNSRRPHGMLVGKEIDDTPDFGGMTVRRAHERGIITSWDMQRDVWASLFSEDRGLGLTQAKRGDTTLILTEPVGAPMHTRTACDELVFEEYKFRRCAVVPCARLLARGSTMLVLDSGFSFTTAVSVVDGWELANATRRLAVGGKALTNHLKTIVSYRSWNMLDEPMVMNAVKERCCRVSLDYVSELAACTRTKGAQYVLPDASTIGSDPLGHVRTEKEVLDGTEQVLVMSNEGISVPELLFSPDDAGVPQCGVAELIVQSVDAAPEEHRADLYANILLVGGNCLFENFVARLIAELRPLVDQRYEVKVSVAPDPIRASLQAGISIVTEDEEPPYRVVSKADYDEYGSAAMAERFFFRELDT